MSAARTLGTAQREGIRPSASSVTGAGGEADDIDDFYTRRVGNGSGFEAWLAATLGRRRRPGGRDPGRPRLLDADADSRDGESVEQRVGDGGGQ